MIVDVDLGLREAPQVWLAAALALLGVGVLELGGGGEGATIGMAAGDIFSVLQAVGFGTSFFITERMMTINPTQALPITATQCAVAALCRDSGRWATARAPRCLRDPRPAGSSTRPHGRPTRCPACFWPDGSALHGVLRGSVDGAGDYRRQPHRRDCGPRPAIIRGLGPAATEPLWAALFAALYIGEGLGTNDAVGGALLVGAFSRMP